MTGDRFLLIKTWSNRLWSDVEHVLGQLLIAEITNRIPVVYWPTHCLHNGFIHTNGFELYFEPVSNYSIFDLAKPDYTFYPPFWDADNLLVEDAEKEKWTYRSIGDFISSDANVVIGDVYFTISEIIPFIRKDNAAYGMTATEIYRYLLKSISGSRGTFFQKCRDSTNRGLRIRIPCWRSMCAGRKTIWSSI